MRFLCICEGGNVRSRAMAYVLHDLKGHEAIPIGRRWASLTTLHMMCLWADVVVVMQPEIASCVPKEFRSKVKVVDVGPDRYGLHIPADLLAQCQAGAKNVLHT